ncbi:MULTISPECIES: hypothetical protein [unclassified Streptomyces]|nr:MULTISPECIES: hypothetical protein [unclassified Streptomyces]
MRLPLLSRDSTVCSYVASTVTPFRRSTHQSSAVHQHDWVIRHPM